MDIPVVQNTYTEDDFISIGSEGWYSWLNNTNSFRYKPSSDGYNYIRAEITVRNRNSKGYWYAYRKFNQKQFTYYLGKSSELSYERLQLAVDELTLASRNPIEYQHLQQSKKGNKGKSVSNKANGCTISEASGNLYNSLEALSEIETLRAANEQLKEEIKKLEAKLDDSLKLENLQHQIRSIQNKLACKEKGYAANSAASLIRDIKSL
jgi:hypothetical protein